MLECYLLWLAEKQVGKKYKICMELWDKEMHSISFMLNYFWGHLYRDLKSL